MKKLHKGKMGDCKVCTPEQKPKRRNRTFEPRVVLKVRGLEGNVRRQMSEEIGEDELTKDFKFALFQKYGLITARIDRRVTKPNWMEEKVWRLLKQEFYKATKGLVPERTRFTTKPAGAARSQSPSQSQFRANRYNPRHPRNNHQTSVQQG